MSHWLLHWRDGYHIRALGVQEPFIRRMSACWIWNFNIRRNKISRNKNNEHNEAATRSPDLPGVQPVCFSLVVDLDGTLR